jgi:hypothetical protein
MDNIVYISKDGKKHKKPPRGIPPFKLKPLVDGNGCSSKNGKIVAPKLDGRLRKHGKKI